MAQIKNLIAKWGAAWPSPMIISRQYDNGQYRIDLFNYPEPEHIVDEQTEQMEVLSYYLIVWMKETENGEPREMSPIQLPGPYWIVPNYYTQLVQDIRFQFCVQSDSTDYEAHSAIFTGRIVDSIEHDGDPVDVTPAEMFDAYKAYIQEIAMAAGAVVIDPNLDTAGAAADAKAVGDALSSTNERLDNVKAELNAAVGFEDAVFKQDFVLGKTIGSYGGYENNNNRIATQKFTDISNFNLLKYSVTSGYRFLIAFYSSASESSFITSKYWLTGSGTLAIDGDYTRVAYASLNDSTALTLDDIDKVAITFEYALKSNISELQVNSDDIMQVSASNASLPFLANYTIGGTGGYSYQVGRLATHDFIDISDKTSIIYNVTSGYRFLIAFYSSASESSFISAKYWITGNGSILKEGNYIRLTLASVGDATSLTIADVNKLSVSYGYPLYEKITKTEYAPFRIENNLISDGLMVNSEAIQNGVSSASNYGNDNVMYKVALPEHKKIHVCFDYRYTKNVPYVSSGYIDIFQYSTALYGSERHLGMGQFGILSRRISGVYARGSSVNQFVFGNGYTQRMGIPALLLKYTGEYDNNTTVTITVGTGTLTIDVNNETVDSISYASTDTIQSLADALNAVTGINCTCIDTYGTCEDLLLINGGAIALLPEAIISFGWDKTWHTFEAIIDRENLSYVMSFDGVTLSGNFTNPVDSFLIIGGSFNGSTTPIRLRNLAIDIDSYGDAEVVNAPVSASASVSTKQLISNRNPRLLIFEGHGIVVGSDAYAETLTGAENQMAVSTDRLDAVFSAIKANGYVPVSWKDVVAWKQGNKNLPKRCFTIMFDDYRVENYVDYDKRRPFVKHGVRAGLAIVSDTHELSDTLTINGETYTVKEIFDMIELAGWYPCSHTKDHRRNGDYNSTQLIDAFKADALSCNKHGIYSDILVYPYGSTNYTVTSTMLLSDFAIGIDVDNGGTVYNCKGINMYLFQRTEIGTRAALANVIAPFV